MRCKNSRTSKKGRWLGRMVRRSKVYHGPYATYGPDLHVELDHYNMISFPLFATDGKIISQQIRGDSGCHRSEGILIATGPGIRQKRGRRGAPHLRDLAPTIMHLVGLPVPSHMDGRVFDRNPGPRARHPLFRKRFRYPRNRAD